MRIFSIILVLFWCQLSIATMTYVGITNNLETITTESTSAVSISTGLIDATCATTTDGIQGCSACKDAGGPGPWICNEKQIDLTGWLVITIKTDNTALFPTTGSTTALKAVYSSSTEIPVDATKSTPSTNLAANTNLTVALKWTDICSAVGTTGCTGSFSKTFQVGISKAGTTTLDEYITVKMSHRYVTIAAMAAAASTPVAGYMTLSSSCTGATAYELFCYYRLYPGDEKVFLYDLTLNASNTSYYVPNLTTAGSEGTADSSNQKYKYVRLYYEPSSAFTDIVPGTSSSFDLPLNTTSGSITDKKLPNLLNSQEYVFLAAAVDDGGTATFFAKPGSAQLTTSAMLQAGTPEQSATPGPVYGLLEGSKCFIATAAYGSEMAPEVEVLRQFRNQFLLTNTLGRFFVKTYYWISPPIANFIARHESIRTAVRWTLQPFVNAAHWLMETK